MESDEKLYRALMCHIGRGIYYDCEAEGFDNAIDVLMDRKGVLIFDTDDGAMIEYALKMLKVMDYGDVVCESCLLDENEAVIDGGNLMDKDEAEEYLYMALDLIKSKEDWTGSLLDDLYGEAWVKDNLDR